MTALDPDHFTVRRHPDKDDILNDCPGDGETPSEVFDTGRKPTGVCPVCHLAWPVSQRALTEREWVAL